MPYAYPTNIPRPAVNWTADEQKKCVAAANAVLASGKSEQQAIFACIHAAGRTEHPGGEKTMGILERLAEMFNGFAKSLRDEGAVPETPAQGNTFAVYKQADGAYRWFGWVSNHFRDRDNPPEILSSKAHQDFVAYADKTKNYPELWLWHVPGSKVGQADWVDFADGFLMASGTFVPGKEDVAEKLAKTKESLKMSHGFVRLKPMNANGVTDAYRTFEVSPTPEGPEANPWTSFNTIQEADMLSKEKRAFLAKYLDEATIAGLEGKTDELRKAAELAGADWKEIEVLEKPAEATAPEAKLDLESLVGPLADAIAERLQMANLSTVVAELKAKADAHDGLTAQVAELTAAVKGLQKSDDEKVAAAVTPRAAQVFSWMGKAASKSPDTVLKEGDKVDESLKSSRPHVMEMADHAIEQIVSGR